MARVVPAMHAKDDALHERNFKQAEVLGAGGYGAVYRFKKRVDIHVRLGKKLVYFVLFMCYFSHTFLFKLPSKSCGND